MPPTSIIIYFREESDRYGANKNSVENIQWFSGMLGSELVDSVLKAPNIGAIGAVEDGVACGILVFCEEQTFIRIEYLLIADDYRRKGTGTLLADYLCRQAEPLQKTVYSYFQSHESQGLHGFFLSMPRFFVRQGDALCYRISLAELAKKNLLDDLNLPKMGKRFLSLPQKLQKDFYSQQELVTEGIVHPKDFYDQLCLATVSDGKITACALVEKGTTDGIYLSYAWVLKGYERSIMAILCEIRGIIMSKNRSSDKYIYISAVSQQAIRLIRHLFPGTEPYGEYWEASYDSSLA